MKKGVLIILLACLLPGIAVATTTLSFDVYLDDKKIGLHEVRISEEGDEKHVTVQANMQVNLLFITLFNYQHEARERWRQGCITQLDTQTLDDGERLSVTGLKVEKGLKVISNQESTVINDCVRTFAYWDPQLLSSNYLLNTQNGKYEPAQFINEGEQPLMFNGMTYGQKRYRLNVGEEVVIQLWYDIDNSWQALETRVAGGRKLRYLRQERNL
jgi:hypothetical protein